MGGALVHFLLNNHILRLCNSCGCNAVNAIAGGMIDTFDSYVWEPSLVKANAITAATEAACLVLSVDETITNPRSEVQ